jgi:adenosyl cobinamide kinase/adenosyl cobinamide phosphate guanylyltransferase
MTKYFILIWASFSFITSALANAETTQRITQFSNDRVNVWETIIYPTKDQQLKMHRHQYDRVLVAFDDGTLKITNDQGKIHYLKLEKGKAYYLSKDLPNELHTDENIGTTPIKVLVTELKDGKTG